MERAEILQKLEDAQHRMLADFLEGNPDCTAADYGDIPGAMEYYRQLPTSELLVELRELTEK